MIRIRNGEPSDAAGLALMHAAVFTPTEGQTWNEENFAGLMVAPGACARIADNLVDDTMLGFILGRGAAGEAEIVTLAVLKTERRAGIGRALVASLAARIVMTASSHAARLALEVAADNDDAAAFYARLDFTVQGRRTAYYTRPGGSHADALVMTKILR